MAKGALCGYRAGRQAKMASIELWIPWNDAHGSHSFIQDYMTLLHFNTRNKLLQTFVTMKCDLVLTKSRSFSERRGAMSSERPKLFSFPHSCLCSSLFNGKCLSHLSPSLSTYPANHFQAGPVEWCHGSRFFAEIFCDGRWLSRIASCMLVCSHI